MGYDQASSAAQAKIRLIWLDVAKGIGIILVVVGHVNRGLVNAKILPNSDLVLTTDEAIYSFHMPLFFLLSGLIVPRSLLKGRYSFLISKLQTVLYPYVLWSFIQGSLQVFLSSEINAERKLSDLLMIGWRPFGQFWFLYTLMACYLIIAFIPRNRALLITICLIAASLYHIPAIQPLYLLQMILYGLTFYLPGVLLTEKVGESLPTRWWNTLLLLALFFAAFALNRVLLSMNIWAIGSVITAFLGIWATLSISNVLRGSWQRILVSIGTMSMSIFVMHVLVGAGTRIALKKVGVLDPTIHVLAGIILGIAVPMGIHQILSRLNMLHYFGLGPIPRVRVDAAITPDTPT